MNNSRGVKIICNFGGLKWILLPSSKPIVMAHYRKDMKQLTLILAFSLLTAMTFAQTQNKFEVRGTATWKETNYPVTGYIYYQKDKAVVTDSLGHFMINSLDTGTYILSFNSIGLSKADTTITITKSNVLSFSFKIPSTCNDINAAKAQSDIKNNQIKLFLSGSVAPTFYPTDKKFEKAFKLSYDGYSDFKTENIDCYLSYNKVIFDYLDKQYGTRWRESVRADVEGIKRINNAPFFGKYILCDTCTSTIIVHHSECTTCGDISIDSGIVYLSNQIINMAITLVTKSDKNDLKHLSPNMISCTELYFSDKNYFSELWADTIAFKDFYKAFRLTGKVIEVKPRVLNNGVSEVYPSLFFKVDKATAVDTSYLNSIRKD